MAVKKYGKSVWGISDDETGLLTTSISYSFSADKGEVQNASGEVVGVTFYNDKVDVSVDGKYDTDAAGAVSFTATLGSALTLVNSIPDHLFTATGASTCYIETVDVNSTNTDYQGVSFKGTVYPYVLTT